MSNATASRAPLAAAQRHAWIIRLNLAGLMVAHNLQCRTSSDLTEAGMEPLAVCITAGLLVAWLAKKLLKIRLRTRGTHHQ